MAILKRLAEEKKELTQKAIQKAAKKVFFEKGYLNTTIAEIAKLAGVAKGSIYLYFQTKDDLYLSLMVPILEEIKKSLTDLKDKITQGQYRTGSEIMTGFYNHYKRIYSFDPDGIRIIQAFQLGDLISTMSEKNREELNLLARENFRLSRNIFSLAMKHKAISRMSPAQLVDISWSTFIGVVQLEESKLRLTKKDHLDATLRATFSILAKGLSL
jgi:AcrR family transcriptional regulator